MKTYIILALICSLFSVSGKALTKVEIKTNNISALSTPNSFFIIKDKIDLSNQTVKIGFNSVLSFEGGHFYKGIVDINGASVKAANYCIFDGTDIKDNYGKPCKFNNDVVPALWFGEVGNDVGKVVNRALSLAPKNVVSLGGGTYTLISPIIMNQSGQQLQHSGTLILGSDSASIKLEITDLNLNLHNIIGKNSGKPKEQFTGSAIEFIGNVYHADIKVDNINGVKYGISFVPDPFLNYNSNATEVYAGIQYCKIDFMNITAEYGIYMNLDKNFSKGESIANINHGSTWLGDNQIFGGIINADYGIYYDDSLEDFMTENKDKYESSMDGNVFNHITFGECNGIPLYLRKMNISHFPYTCFSDDAKECPIWINLAHLRNLEIGVLDEVPYSKVAAGEGVFGAIIDAPITENDIDSTKFVNRMCIFCDQPWLKGPSTKYLTSTITQYNMVKTLDYPNITTNKYYTLTIEDLLATLPIDMKFPNLEIPSDISQISPLKGPTILSDLCVINIGARQHVTLDLTQKTNFISIPFTIVVNISNSTGGFGYKNDESGFQTNLSSGTYRVTWDQDWKPLIVKIG